MNMIHLFEEQVKHDDPDNFGSEIDYEESDEESSQTKSQILIEEQNPVQEIS